MVTRVALRFAQVFLGLMAGLVIGEGVVGLYFPASAKDRYYAWEPGLKVVLKPSPQIFPGTTTPSRFSINSQGIRGDEFAAAQNYRLLAIGGSTTECLYLDDAKTWPQVLQDDLNETRSRQVWVGNVGKSGMDTRHHIFYLHYMLPQLPEIDTVVMLVGVNDLWHFALNRTPEQTTDQVELSRAFWQTARAERSNEPFYKKTALWQLGREVYDGRLFRPPVRGFAQDTEGAIYAALRQRRQNATEFTDDLPDLTPALDYYRRNLNALVDVAHARAVRLIFVTQPTMWNPALSPSDANLLWSGAVEYLGLPAHPAGAPDRYYSVRALDRAMTRYNDALLEVCRARGIECVDLASQLPRDATVFYDDIHFNEKGAQRVAGILADYLSQRAPFKP